MIYGPRLRDARLLLGETQKDFAHSVGLVQSQLSSIERSPASAVAEHVLLSISEHTGFPPGFFERPEASTIEDIQFRARLRFKAADRNRIITYANLIHESYVLMRRLTESVPVRIPRMAGMKPAVAASEFRRFLELPTGPVANLTLPVERHGLVVLALPATAPKHDAISWWHRVGDEPYPALATLAGAPGDRLRWSLAHEIGHLLLHGAGAGREYEREADEFAAELLTPLNAMRGEIPMSPKLGALYAMKLRWGVSVQSLIRRAKDIGHVTDDQYMSLFRQVSARGERMNERFQVGREKPRAYRRMAEVLFGETPATGLSELCGWTEEFARDVLDQFATRGELPSRRVLVGRQSANVIQLRR